MIEGIPSSPISPDKGGRPETPTRHRESMTASPEKMERESQRGSPGPGPTWTPVVRPSARRPQQQSILGENTPPQSATMLALQNMPAPVPKEAETQTPPAPALSNVTNNSMPTPKPQLDVDQGSLSSQIVTLTNIATSLQKEMAALSRRSRDNATDLMSLKQATNSRDEDIRKTLRDLMGNLNDKSKDPFYTGLLIDSKAHNIRTSPPSSLSHNGRPFSLPRIPSPNSFAASIDRDSVCTPSMSAADAPATIALLEKIIRDMGTREGQDLLIARLTEVAEKLAGMASATKVEELLRMIKQRHTVHVNDIDSGLGLGPRDMDFDDASSGGRPRSRDSHSTSDFVNDDILKIIKSVKDSVSQGGGLTAEVKALVRELRGEVLGMGRELRRRLDEVANNDERSLAGHEETDEVKRIIGEGLDELRDQMDSLLREHRRQSGASAVSRASHIDYQEIYNAMRAALKDSQASLGQDQHPQTRDDVIDAVREAWENYKPEIEVQQFGLERDEILACLQEGLQNHEPRDDQPVGATREEVFRAVVEGLKHFVPPQMETPASLSRDEILEAVRECLEEFEFPVAPSALGNDLSRDDMVQAVKEGLHGFDFPESRALAVSQPSSDAVMAKLAEIVEFMRLEFRSVSDEARENVAANGRDTEQVLDATKDGLDKLRQDMEDYVDRVSGMSSRGGSSEDLARTLDGFRDEISRLLETQIESLRDSVNMSLVPAGPAHNPMKEGLEGIKERLDRIRGELQRPLAGTTEILDAIQEGMSDLHIRIEKLGDRPPDLSANDEILDALRDGLNSVRAEMEGIRDSRERDNEHQENNDRAIAPYISNDAGPSGDGLKQEDIKNLESMITELRIKIETMEEGHNTGARSMDSSSSRTEEMLSALKDAVEGIATKGARDRVGSAITPDSDLKEDVQAIETILRNTKARLDDLIDGEQAVRKEQVDGLEAAIRETRDSLGLITTQMDNAARQADITKLEDLINHLAATYDELKENSNKELDDPERVTRTDVQAVEAVCLDVKGLVNELSKGDLAALATKDELNGIIGDLKERIDSIKESNSNAVAERDAEAIDVNARIKEVKEFLAEFQDLTRSRLEDGIVGVETVGKLLESMGELADNNASFGIELKDMFETMKLEFEESRNSITGAKIDSEDKLQETTDSLASKIDERIDELVAKYDEFQASLEERAKTGDARDEATEAAVVGTKAVADELKLLTDTLGSTVTESLERMEEASKTVFTRVEDLVTRADENHTEDKEEHEQTRERVKEALAVVENLREPISEMQPKILEAVKELLGAINEHYDYAKTASTDIQQKIEDAKPEIPEKYDDTAAQEKLDKLVTHSEVTDEAFAKLDAALTEKFESIASNTGEKLDTVVNGNEALDVFLKEKLESLFVNSEATGEAVSKFDGLLKEKLDALTSSNTERLDGILVNTEATGEAFSQFDTSVREKIDGLVSSTTEKLEGILVNTEATGEGFSQLDANIKERLDKIFGNTSATTESFANLDMFLKEKLVDLVDRTDATGESVSQLDSDLKERLEKLSEQTTTAGKAFDQLDGDLKDRLEKLSDQTLTAGKAFDRLDGSVEAKLGQLIDQTQATGKTFEEIDGRTQGKLDTLVDHSQSTANALERLEALDRIHGQVVATAATISEFLASQTQRISDEHEDRERAAQEAAVVLERRTAEREAVEDSVAALREEEARLRASVLGLRSENESLGKQKMRLAADVSSLETALRLRKEELGEMEERAEGLEKRILEGVMNHSRVLLMSKNQTSDSMSRKRVRPKAEGVQEKKPVLNAALSKRSLGTPGGSPAAAGSRRIVSLSQINSNVPTGGFKRSHSVKAPSGVGRGGLRKGSWTGGLVKGYGELDKENVGAVKEEDEGEDREVAGLEEEPAAPEGGMQLVSLRERDVEAEVEREMTGRSSGSTLTEDDGMTESEADFVSVDGSNMDGGASERDDASVTDAGTSEGTVSEAGTLRRSSRATDTSSSVGTYDYSDYDSDYTGSDVTESAAESVLGNEVVLVQGQGA